MAVASLGIVLVVIGYGLEWALDRLDRIVAVRTSRNALLISGSAAAAAWLGAFGAVRAIRQPRTPEPGAPTADLRAEPPALANMLVNDFRPTRDAVPATLLDLAARRIVAIDRSATGGYDVRVRPGTDEDVAPYEARVLELLRARAHGGVVPAGALTTGPGDRAASWWRSFQREVVAEAKGRGLSRDLWDAGVLRTLGSAALVPAALLALGFRHAGAGLAALLVTATMLSGARAGGRQRDTQAGSVAAAAWLGVRRYLRQGAFADLPPSAVVIWERYLSYGAALGVAAEAVRSIPMGADDDRRAWTAASGQWRQVEVRYPRWWPPAWGMNPWAALGTSVAVGTFAAVFLSTFLRTGLPVGLSDDPFAPIGLAFVAVPGVAGLLAAITLVRAAGDLAAARRVTGVVLRLRRYRSGESEHRCYVAIDDGRSGRIRAFRVRPAVYREAGLVEQRRATAEVTPNLGYVRSLRPGS
ncbi:MAG TPA: hypothetical protein VHL78_03135 [Actinomycetota bacterium]|nr:hypothetical protein [Actinomycetota bacterium]